MAIRLPHNPERAWTEDGYQAANSVAGPILPRCLAVAAIDTAYQRIKIKPAEIGEETRLGILRAWCPLVCGLQGL
jgi:hypothetical protein